VFPDINLIKPGGKGSNCRIAKLINKKRGKKSPVLIKVMLPLKNISRNQNKTIRATVVSRIVRGRIVTEA